VLAFDFRNRLLRLSVWNLKNPFPLSLSKRLSIIPYVSIKMNKGKGVFVFDLIRPGLTQFLQLVLVLREQLDVMESQHLKKGINLNKSLLI